MPEMNENHTVGDIRVWYIPQVPMKAYEVDVPSRNLREAMRLQEALIGFSVFEYENRIKPDYADAAGIARYEEDGAGGFDWFEVDAEELANATDKLQSAEARIVAGLQEMDRSTYGDPEAPFRMRRALVGGDAEFVATEAYLKRF